MLLTPERTELPQHVQSSEMARYVIQIWSVRDKADLVSLFHPILFITLPFIIIASPKLAPRISLRSILVTCHQQKLNPAVAAAMATKTAAAEKTSA